MNLKVRMERACFRGLGILLITAGVVHGTPLWNNGPPLTTAGPCDGSCGATSGPVFTVFDNFTVGPNKWFVTGFDYTDIFVNVFQGSYTSTVWSIWSGDPLAGGQVVASGQSVASMGACTGIGPNMCLIQLTVSGIVPVVLSSGTTYYLAAVTLGSNGLSTQRALSSGSSLPGYEQSNGNGTAGLGNPPPVGTQWVAGTSNTTFATGNTAFDIIGTELPEPGTLSLMGLAIAGLWFRRWHKATT